MRKVLVAVAACVLWAGCSGDDDDDAATTPTPSASPSPSTIAVALPALGSGNYLGFEGGLYAGGANTPPSAHDAAGIAAANGVQPLDPSGNPSASGKIVLLSIGMSNTTQEFCSQNGLRPCNAWTFAGQASADATVDTANLLIVNGARGGQTAESWDAPNDPNYTMVLDSRLGPAGATEAQVQVVWVKVAHAQPTVGLPATTADAYGLETDMGEIVRALKVRYPNVKQVFFSSRIYAGHATTALNPEPYAYESGFGVKWVIDAQIVQRGGGAIDAQAGDLKPSAAPWIAWGPYLWDDTWPASDFESDGTHPAQAAELKVGTALLTFFKTSPYTECWFVESGTCP